ncbi:CaiB/BaiF CoA-transferase family protein [Temperatibacter marinus]|uniref:CaiB/BaiF CoA-transferase family protein n=1 Tax=Temperatibacter marinus TaxID=1456591 RepID=A0AA52EDB5_9PROT|nr:CaiB/BaiF CoA-transferase family protein [Temperatibacter marinus]WND03362.1 CaiB/BaiF CoA-transferase family protein [Temperatibacter marinus]
MSKNLPLAGLKIVEFQGIGPGPFCGMHFADLGADVIVIERPHAMLPAAGGITRRGKRSIVLDLKKSKDLEVAKNLIASADGVFEGNRPGVMERLGLGPEEMQGLNPKLVYGRLTGWGQDGPLADYAGHDINYAAITGALFYTGAAGEKPLPTPTLLADIAGGAHYLMIGMLSALLKAKETGQGDIIDAAMIDGLSHMMNLVLDIVPSGMMALDKREVSLLDGPHWYNAYATSDNHFVTLGPLEPQFYGELLSLLDLDMDSDFLDQMNMTKWADQAEKLTALFKTKTRDEWVEKLHFSNACFAPVLTLSEAKDHPHMKARRIYDTSANLQQAVAAPRFQSSGRQQPNAFPNPGQHSEDILKELENE